MLSLEQDYTGADFNASIKAMNPSMLDGGLTGIFVGSYMQSVTPRLALGLEGVWQRAAVDHGPEMAMSYAARYRGEDWVGSAQMLAQGGVQASYWRRLTEKVEAGVDVTLQFAGLNGGMMGGRGGKEGVTTLGAKYDFRASSFRAQVDSQGRLGCLLEKRVAPPVQVTFAGEIDHAKVYHALTSSFIVNLLTQLDRTKPRLAWPYQLKPPMRKSWPSKRPPAPPCHRRSKPSPPPSIHLY